LRSPDLNLLTIKPQSLASVLDGITATAPIYAAVAEQLAIPLPPNHSIPLYIACRERRDYYRHWGVWNKLIARASRRSVVDYNSPLTAADNNCFHPSILSQDGRWCCWLWGGTATISRRLLSTGKTHSLHDDEA